jgi:hypothetical protein
MVEASMVIPGLDDRFGLCPGCRREGLIMPVRNGDWFACEDCRVRWRVGTCTFSFEWNGVTYPAPVFDFECDDYWLANAKILVRYRRVEPFYLRNTPGFVMPRKDELDRRAQQRQFGHAQAHPTLQIGARLYDRLQYGSQVEDSDRECPECTTPAGTFHVPSCVRERCPRCGRCGISFGDEIDALIASCNGCCGCYVLWLCDSDGARAENETWVPRACRWPASPLQFRPSV